MIELSIISKEKDLSEFIEWLVPYFREYLIAHINDKKLLKFDEFVSTSIKWDYKNKTVKSRDILIASTYHLRTKINKDKYSIYIDYNDNIPQSSAKFIDIIKLINFGNLSFTAYPIYTNTIKYFENNIDYYYSLYLEE